MQNTHITIHQPGEYVFVMSRSGRVLAFEIQEDGHPEVADVAAATAQMTIAQEKARKEMPF
jgi:6-phosphogluconolactonase (cycloisomerase 2 family)